MIPIEKRQITLIKIGQKSLGIDDATYRAMLAERFSVDSCTRLSRIQAAAFLSELRGKGFKPVYKGRPSRKPSPRPSGKSSPRQAGNMVRLASQAQHEKIAAVARLIDWRVRDGLTRWLFKRYSISRVKTAQEAFLAIEGLKKMFENQMKKHHGENWMLRTWENEDVARYIREHLEK